MCVFDKNKNMYDIPDLRLAKFISLPQGTTHHSEATPTPPSMIGPPGGRCHRTCHARVSVCTCMRLYARVPDRQHKWKRAPILLCKLENQTLEAYLKCCGICFRILFQRTTLNHFWNNILKHKCSLKRKTLMRSDTTIVVNAREAFTHECRT